MIAKQENAGTITACKQNEVTGKEVLDSTPNKPAPIPSLQTILEEGIKDLRRTLRRVEKTEDILAAKAAVTQALNVGWHTVPRLELIRAIESRLPAPSKHQIDRCSLTKHLPTETILFGRVIGAFGDSVLFLTDNKYDETHPPTVRIMTVSAAGNSAIPEWDTERKPERRSFVAPIIDAEYSEPVTAEAQSPIITA